MESETVQRAWNQAAKLVVGHILSRDAATKGTRESRPDVYCRAEAITLLIGACAERRIFNALLDQLGTPADDLEAAFSHDEYAAYQIARDSVEADEKQRERAFTPWSQFKRWRNNAFKDFEKHSDKIQTAVEWMLTGYVPSDDELDNLCGLRCLSDIRGKRSSIEVDAIKAEIAAIVEQFKPMTVRQVFYQLVVRGSIAKDEMQYGYVSDWLVKMRQKGVVPWESIVDLTRRVHEPVMFNGPAHAISNVIRGYRLDPWKDAPVRPWIWLEKDALLGVIAPVCKNFRVPVCPGRGFGSETYIREVAMDIVSRGQTAAIYEFGDHDPSGVTASKNTGNKLLDFIRAEGGEATFKRIAVTSAQIAEMDLPTRQTKESTHSKGWKGPSAELDAIPPDVLRAMVKKVIERHTDEADFEATYEQEEIDKALLRSQFE